MFMTHKINVYVWLSGCSANQLLRHGWQVITAWNKYFYSLQITVLGLGICACLIITHIGVMGIFRLQQHSRSN